jgi:folate-binding protein YgfZ
MRDYFPVDSVTVIAISGKDRLKWLNNLVTNDLKGTSEHRAVECFVTDVKGRTLAHGIVFANLESLIFFSWGKAQAERLMTHWDRYIIREDVTLADESARWRWAFVERGWLTNALQREDLAKLNSMDVASVESQTGSLAIACPAIGEDWLLVGFNDDDSISTLLKHRDSDLSAEDKIALQASRIRQRWPLVDIDFDDKNLPQELDRNETAISFNKGCYLGQETVARLDALGQVQKKLVLLSIDVDAREGANELLESAIVMKDDQEAGRITSLSPTEAGSSNAVALAYIRRAYFAPGTTLSCHGFSVTVQ